MAPSHAVGESGDPFGQEPRRSRRNEQGWSPVLHRGRVGNKKERSRGQGLGLGGGVREWVKCRCGWTKRQLGAGVQARKK